MRRRAVVRLVVVARRPERQLTPLSAFLRGAGSILAIFPEPVRGPRLRHGSLADDRRALAGDWQRVGQDMRVAMARVDRQLHGARPAAPRTNRAKR